LAQPFDREEVTRILSSAVRERRHHSAPRRGPRTEEKLFARCAAG
jgi:hypothetical protein